MMIEIDGSFGEGGGQILRSSLALAIVTGQPVRLSNIRAGRRKPGLMRQHLTAVNAAAAICGATVDGERIGATELTFTPGAVRAGEYQFSIGTAGSTTLVLQTVLLPLLTAGGPSRIVLEGGTHNPFAPPFDFLERAYLPLINRMGPNVRATLERPGFYPAGGGRIAIEIEPATGLHGFELCARGDVVRRRARAVVANLSCNIAKRELGVIQKRLGWDETELEVVEIAGAPGPGNIVTLELTCEHVAEVFTGFGEVSRSAEAVATHAVQQCQRYLKTAAPVGEYLTDQLMLPLALAGQGEFVSTGLSRHAETHLALIREFLNVRVETQRCDGGVRVRFG
jgi:RNA 3'-terminal phosphate cyclase (ATP)